MLITFSPGDAPDRPTHEALRVGRGLADTSEEELRSLLEHARPYTRLPHREGLFTETRVGKKGER